MKFQGVDVSKICDKHFSCVWVDCSCEFGLCFRSFRGVRDWLFEVWLVYCRVRVLCLFRAVYSGWEDFLAYAEVQGRKDDLEEEALFRFQDELERWA